MLRARFEHEGRQLEGQMRGSEIVVEGRRFDPAAVTLLPPCSPSKIIATGKNYASHVEEMGQRGSGDGRLPEFPFLFYKPPSALVGSGGEIVYPDLSEHVEFEGELGVVIGNQCRNVPVDEVEEYIAGYTCANDISARDWGARESQWVRSKGMDTFCPVGPYLQTSHPEEVELRTRVNGTVKQSANTREMVFSSREIVHEISRFMTLEPGDLVLTGTPHGVDELQRGDTVEVEIEGIGVLENEVV